MITLRAKIQDRTPSIIRTAKKRNIETLSQAGAYVRSVIRFSIRRSKRASVPGEPPKTRRGALRQSLLFSVEKERERVLIGPAASRIGIGVGGAHEFGERFRGRSYPERPFSRPGILAAAPRLPKQWQGFIRG